MLSGEWFSFLWRGFAARLIDGARECALGRFVAGALAQRVAVIGYDLGGAARCLVEGLRSRGGDVVAVDHVGICTSLEGMLNEGARAHIAVWGEFDRELQARHRGPGCRVEVIGSMRRDFAVSGGADTTGGVARRPKMVIITSVTSIDERMYGWAKPGGVRRTWQRLMPWLSAHPEWDVVIKAHPRYDHYDFYEKLIAGRGPGSTVSLARAEEVLRGADVAVLMNVPSTAVVHALQAGVPVIYLCDNVFHDYRTPLEQGGAVCCSTTAEFEVEVERILTDASYRAAICGRQKKFLNRALAATGEESARRMMEFVESVASRTDGRGAESPPARWIIDLLAALNYLMMGAVDEHGFQRELAALKERGALLSFAAVENLRVDLIGAYFLRVATWGEWTCENPPFRPRVLWMVFRALPRSLRPSWSDLRAHLVHSLDEESGAGRGSVVRRLMCRLAVILLAPGRLIDRGRKA